MDEEMIRTEDIEDFLEASVFSDSTNSINLDALPEWWAQAIREHTKFDLPAYRPPRFSDGVLAPPKINEIESEFGIDVRLVGTDVTRSNEWTVIIDGSEAFTVGRHRDTEGYTRYETPSDEFEERIHTVIDVDRTA